MRTRDVAGKKEDERNMSGHEGNVGLAREAALRGFVSRLCLELYSNSNTTIMIPFSSDVAALHCLTP